MHTLSRVLVGIVSLWLTAAAARADDYLLHDLKHALDEQLAGKTPAQSIAIYSSRDMANGVYVRNVNLWTTLDLTGTTANNWGGVAISPRHVLYSAHASAGVGNEIHFVTADNVTVKRTITAMQTAPGYVPYWPDWRIALLNADLPSTITYARVLPDNWTDHLPANLSTHRLPTIGLNQFREATVQDLNSPNTGGTQPMANTLSPIDAQRQAFYRNKISGDSSSPLLLDVLGQPVVLAVWTFGGSGSGTSVVAQKTAINAVMANLGGGYQLTDAALTTAPALLPFTTDFETADGYKPGYFRPSPGFTATLEADVVTPAYSGSQALSFTGLGALTFKADGWSPGYTGVVTWLDFYLKPVVADLSELPPEAKPGMAAITGFVRKTATTGELYVVNGDGEGGGDWLPTGYTLTHTADQAAAWQRISYRLDYTHKRWDLYVDGNLVQADLGFADNAATPFSQVRLSGDPDKTAYLDYFYAGSDNPLFADTSGLGLPDSWLLAHGLNPSTAERYGDPDHDGVNNLTEYKLGLSPNGPDTDNDGLFDRRELLWGTNPAVAETHALGALPYTDGFETDLGAFATGTRLWRVQKSPSATVNVTTTGAPEGGRALALTGSDIVLDRPFADPTHAPVVWLDFRLKAAPRAEAPEQIPADVAAVFYFTTENQIRVLNGGGQGGGEWLTLPATPAAWNRVSLRMDYAAQRWALWLNGVRIAEHLGFAHPVPYFSGFALQHSAPQTGGLDAFQASHAEPTALDNDNDGLPNTWEVTYGLNPDDPTDASVSHSGDGWTNAEKYQFGVSPLVSHLSGLPFAEPFEQLPSGNLTQGARNWFSLGSALPQVQTTQTHEGAQALMIPASEAGIRVVNRIDGTGHSLVWTQFALKPAPYPNTATPALPNDSTAGLFFTQEGKLRVYDGPVTGWRTLTTITANLTTWHTITLRHDYTTQRWSVWVDGTLAADNLGFAHPQVSYNKFEVTGSADGPTYVDAIRVQTLSPLTNPTLLPEWWRLQHFGTTNVDPSADADQDGLSNLDEYLHGRLPTIADSGGLVSGSTAAAVYVNNTTGHDTTYNGRSAAPNQPTNADGPKATLGAALIVAGTQGRIIVSASPTAYTQTTIPLAGKNLVLRPHGNVRVTP